MKLLLFGAAFDFIRSISSESVPYAFDKVLLEEKQKWAICNQVAPAFAGCAYSQFKFYLIMVQRNSAIDWQDVLPVSEAAFRVLIEGRKKPM